MKSIFNNITHDVYSDTLAPQSQPQPKRKHATPKRWRKPDGSVEILAERLDTKSLVDENNRLHQMQVELKRKKFLGLI